MDVFSETDINLLLLCTLAAILGGFCDFLLKRDDLQKLPKEDPHPMPFPRSITLLIATLVLSAAAGAIVWLLVVDALLPGKGPIARALLLAAFAGFTAPELGLTLKRRGKTILSQELNNDS